MMKKNTRIVVIVIVVLVALVAAVGVTALVIKKESPSTWSKIRGAMAAAPGGGKLTKKSVKLDPLPQGVTAYARVDGTSQNLVTILPGQSSASWMSTNDPPVVFVVYKNGNQVGSTSPGFSVGNAPHCQAVPYSGGGGLNNPNFRINC